ncbi:hypothetical protein GF340_05720 [Candidatus Peregrinibacteria bacterium]|nr:hypothetical protein [Candidatus Peregrinibacteria bacterium]
MKKIALITTIIGSIIILGACQQSDEIVYPYPFDSAKIVYQHSGIVEGQTELLIKGNKNVHNTDAVTTYDDIETEVKASVIQTPEGVYQVDLVNKTATITENTLYNELKKAGSDEERKKILVQMATNGQNIGESTDTKEIAGKTCDVFVIDQMGEVCIWESIALATSLTLGDEETNLEAVSVETNVNIPDSAFEIPNDVTVTDLRNNNAEQ